MIRLLLVEDHAVFRQSLAFMLEQEADFTVVAQASSVAEARAHLAERAIDVALVDIDLPDGSGVAVIQTLQGVNPQGRALVLTGSASHQELARAVEAGASGLLRKTAPLEEIVAATRRLGAGEALLAPHELIQMLRVAGAQRERERAAQSTVGQLTQREREVLQGLAAGLSDKEIGQRLYISGDTVRNHMARILSKLGVESRLQALVFALRHGVARLD
jgi:DNA-binding NarL/FixJ family response regulator